MTEPRTRFFTLPCVRKACRDQLDNPAMPIVMYLGVIGLLALASGGKAPEVVMSTTPTWLTVAWGASLAAGGVMATVAGGTGRTRGESAGHALLLFGLGLYGLALVAENGPVGLGAASAVLALVAMVLIRMRVLRRARKAQRLAQSLVDEGEVPPPWTS